MTPTLSRLFARGSSPASGARRPWVQPVLNVTVVAVLVGPWVFATWSLIDSVIDHL